MKAEHQQEIDQLQRKVSDLQRQLEQQQAAPPHHSANQRPPASTVPPATGINMLTYKRPMRYYWLNINHSVRHKHSLAWVRAALTSCEPEVQQRSQEGARGGQLPSKLPSCPQTNSFEKIFWLHLRLMYPRMSQLGVQTKKIFLLASLTASQHCFVPPFS